MAGDTVETWVVRKPAVESAGGLVASHHHIASDIGARVLASGGNAVDAALTTGFAIGAVEPWMSGIGGGGFMLVYAAREGRVHAFDFNNIAPRGLDPAAYPLVEGTASDLFNWPAVREDRNLHGPLSMAIPGYVAGAALALEQLGTRSWAEVLAPAIELAEAGMEVDWYAALKILTGARELAGFEESRRTYLPDGLPPIGDWGGPVPRIRLGNLAGTLSRLADAGPRDFYEGEIARAIAADAAAVGGTITAGDLAAYRARAMPAASRPYRDTAVHVVPGLNAGPTLHRVLALLAERIRPGAAPDADTYAGYAQVLLDGYEERLATMGHAGAGAPETSTTHLTVVDGDGNVVALTQTLLSLFGSKVMLPETGILMNNSIMSFDPRPGGPNAITPGVYPLSNMCPAIVEREDGRRFGLGASGGRRILPAVMQLISFQVDFGMDMDAAFDQPRLDVSGTEVVTLDERLPAAITDALAARFAVRLGPAAVYPTLYALPNAAGHDPAAGRNVAGANIMSPWAKVSAAESEAAG